jgi:peptidoglycan/xylan/chitin deacetylase (PgdA/CDA1 family)
MTRQMRRLYYRGMRVPGLWPIDHRYVSFLWEILRQVLVQGGYQEILIKYFWPDHRRFAFILTHDVETALGQDFIPFVADLEENLGFRSLFNFVPERYKLNYRLIDDLRRRGFEVGIHGLRHNGKLFDSESTFIQNAARINKHLKEWKAMGFRAELTLRQPEWMQALEIEYDLSFFDTDPFEPVPGGTMSIWPFFLGHFVELPYTLVQDYTLSAIFCENSPRLWLEKVDFIKKYHGMALVVTHPDYLKSKPDWYLYYEFLIEMKKHDSYWHALPGEIAKWWRSRASSFELNLPDQNQVKVLLEGDSIRIAL